MFQRVRDALQLGQSAAKKEKGAGAPGLGGTKDNNEPGLNFDGVWAQRIMNLTLAFQHSPVLNFNAISFRN